MSFQQLDLFGQPIQPTPSPKKQQQILVKPTVIIEEEKIENVVEKNISIKRKPGRPRKIKDESEINKPKPKRGRKSYNEIYSDADLAGVPSDEVVNQKMYYPIRVVAKWFNVSAQQLRFWENEFSILKPKKNIKGDRLFRPEDIQNLKIIHHLLRIKKLSIQGAKDYLKANQYKVEPQVQLQQTLKNIKAFLLELKANL